MPDNPTFEEQKLAFLRQVKKSERQCALWRAYHHMSVTMNQLADEVARGEYLAPGERADLVATTRSYLGVMEETLVKEYTEANN